MTKHGEISKVIGMTMTKYTENLSKFVKMVDDDYKVTTRTAEQACG